MTSTNINDAAQRFADAYTELVENRGHVGRWIAVKLDTGATDKVLYASRREATRFNHGPYTFVQLQPGGIRVRAARKILEFHRALWERGIRFGDPDGPAPIMPHANDPMGGIGHPMNGLN